MNPFCDLWNINYIQNQAAEYQHHFEQEYQVTVTTKKLQEFLNCWDNLEPKYQSQAVTDCCIVLLDYLSKHSK